MSEDISKLLDTLESEIESAKKDKSRLEGIIETLISQMETDFGTATVKEAKDILKDMAIKKEKVIKEESVILEKLKEHYEW